MAIGIGLGAFLLVVVAMIPIFNNANSLTKNIAVKKDELEVITNKVALLSKLDPNVLQERVRILDSALPPRKDVLLYLASIDGLSRELGLTFDGITLSPGDVTDASESAKKSETMVAGLQGLDTEIKIIGSQDGIYSFLRTIEGVLPLMQIKDIKVTVLDSDQYALSLTLSMLWAEPVTADVKGAVALFGAEEEKYFLQLAEYRRFSSVISPTVGDQMNNNLFQPYTVEEVIPQQ